MIQPGVTASPFGAASIAGVRIRLLAPVLVSGLGAAFPVEAGFPTIDSTDVRYQPGGEGRITITP